MRTRHKGRLGRWLLAAGLASAPGCLSCFHPIEAPKAELLHQCQSISRCGRGHVYIFLMDSPNNPLDCANLAGMRDFLNDLGFIKTYYAQPHQIFWLRHEIHKVHREDGDARFVFIGYGLSADLVACLADNVKKDGVHVDLVVYLDGGPTERPENVCRIVNIQADSCLGSGREVEGAENLQLKDAGHYATPTHPVTLETLANELTRVAAGVPVPMSPPADLPVPELPPPRPVPPRDTSFHDEWDFLKPVASLDQRPKELSVKAPPRLTAHGAKVPFADQTAAPKPKPKPEQDPEKW